MTGAMADLSIIIPIYNEESNIDLLYARVKKVASDISDAHELIFIKKSPGLLSPTGVTCCPGGSSPCPVPAASASRQTA